jgi:antitoxin YefM
VTDDREVVIVWRRGARDVALVSADELSSLMETSHQRRSPNNSERLMQPLDRAKRGKGKPESIESLRRSVGLDLTG